jgi:hypothetical protein
MEMDKGPVRFTHLPHVCQEMALVMIERGNDLSVDDIPCFYNYERGYRQRIARLVRIK